MNRPIKFRAWDKGTNQMAKVDAFYQGMSRVDLFLDNFNSMTGRELDDVEIMQFTGLTDKNGKEIYEGDIIKLSITINWFSVANKTKLLVYWNEFTTGFRLDSGGILGKYTPDDPNAHELNRSRAKKCIVIGNIYENPELLK